MRLRYAERKKEESAEPLKGGGPCLMLGGGKMSNAISLKFFERDIARSREKKSHQTWGEG